MAVCRDKGPSHDDRYTLSVYSASNCTEAAVQRFRINEAHCYHRGDNPKRVSVNKPFFSFELKEYKRRIQGKYCTLFVYPEPECRGTPMRIDAPLHDRRDRCHSTNDSPLEAFLSVHLFCTELENAADNGKNWTSMLPTTFVTETETAPTATPIHLKTAVYTHRSEQAFIIVDHYTATKTYTFLKTTTHW